MIVLCYIGQHPWRSRYAATLCRLLVGGAPQQWHPPTLSLSAPPAGATRSYSSTTASPRGDELRAPSLCNASGLALTDLPRHIILIRHGETAGLETLQEDLQIPNHRVPLGERGVEEALSAGKAIQQLLLTGNDSGGFGPTTTTTNSTSNSKSSSSSKHHNQQQHQQQQDSGGGKLFLYTSPFLRCIQTAQHIARALRDDQVVGFQEEVQLREQDWGNFQEPGQQARNYEQRLRYGRFFYRFPDGESAADVYDRMTMFQDHFVRDISCKRFAGNTSVMLVTHGLALRLFLMRWLHWSVDDFLQVHNPPTAEPIVLSRLPLEPCSVNTNSSSSSNSTTSSSSPTSSSDVLVGPESIKQCYGLTEDSLRRLRGVSACMGVGRLCSSKQQLLEWRPYLKQVPPPPAMDPAKEEQLHQLMEVGYGNFNSSDGVAVGDKHSSDNRINTRKMQQ